MMKKGMKANTIHGNPSGGGGVDNKAKKANTIHGPVTTKDDCEKFNKVHGSDRGMKATTKAGNGYPFK
jgi:hypothetical protein